MNIVQPSARRRVRLECSQQTQASLGLMFIRVGMSMVTTLITGIHMGRRIRAPIASCKITRTKNPITYCMIMLITDISMITRYLVKCWISSFML